MKISSVCTASLRPTLTAPRLSSVYHSWPPRIDGILEIRAYEAIRSGQWKQVHSGMGLVMQTIPELIPDTPAKESGLPSEPRQDVCQEFSSIMPGLRLSPGHEREPEEVSKGPFTPTDLQLPRLGQGFITIGHGHLPAYADDGRIHVASVIAIFKAALRYVPHECALPVPLLVAFCKAAASPWR